MRIKKQRSKIFPSGNVRLSSGGKSKTDSDNLPIRRPQGYRKLSMIGTLASVTILAAACGSSSTSAKSSSTTQNSTATTAASNVNLSSIKASLKKLEAVPQFSPPGPKINAAKLKGDKMVAIDCAPSAAPPVQTTQGVVAAGKVAGINVTVLAGATQDIPQEIKFFDQAINSKPVAIVSVGCVPQLLQVPFQAAKTAGIPIIASDDMGPTIGAPGQGGGSLVYGVAAQPMSSEGTILAKEIAVNGPANAKIGFVSTNDIAGSPQIETAFKAGLAKYCPGCKIEDVANVDASLWVTSLAPTISSMLSSHPNLNYLIPVFDGQAPFVASALGSSSADKSIKVITTQGSVGAAMGDVQKGLFFSDVGTSSTWVGWAAMDQAMRAALKLPPESNPILPIRLVTASTLKGVNPSSDAAIYGTSYVAGFKKLWGLP